MPAVKKWMFEAEFGKISSDLDGPLALPAKSRKLVLRSRRVNGTMFYTYVLKSCSDDKLYIGFTSDLKQRFKAHNEGLVFATKSRIPFEIVYYEACLNKEKAVQREKYFKTGFGRKFLKTRI